MREIFLAGCVILVAAPVAAQVAPSVGPAPVRTTPFPDVPRDHWAFDAVEQLRGLGILRGYPAAPTPARKPKPLPARKRGATNRANALH